MVPQIMAFKWLAVGAELPETFPQGLQPNSFAADCGTTEQDAEKGLFSEGNGENHTSGPEGRADFMPLIPGINPRPTARRSFFAACEVVPFQNINDQMAGEHPWRLPFIRQLTSHQPKPTETFSSSTLDVYPRSLRYHSLRHL